jgi:hypothetical protein
VDIPASAPICRDFAAHGYCAKGITCTERHIFECPDYSTTGHCRDAKCRLPHVDRAGKIRQFPTDTDRVIETPEADGINDLSSDGDEDMNDVDSDDVDSDGLEDSMAMAQDGSDDRLSRQDDFVRF